MKLNTGAAVNAMSITDYKRNAPKVEISKTSFLLKTYTGEIINPVGAAYDTFYIKKQISMDILYLLYGRVDQIFGREGLS